MKATANLTSHATKRGPRTRGLAIENFVPSLPSREFAFKSIFYTNLENKMKIWQFKSKSNIFYVYGPRRWVTFHPSQWSVSGCADQLKYFVHFFKFFFEWLSLIKWKNKKNGPILRIFCVSQLEWSRRRGSNIYFLSETNKIGQPNRQFI